MANRSIELRRARLEIAQAIESLRDAIEQLRLAQSEDGSALGLGFVAEDNGHRTRRRGRHTG